MLKKKKIIAMIPARLGSKRIPQKNIRYIDGKPLIQRAIECALQSGVFDEVWVTSSDPLLKDIAESFHARFHQRPAALSGDNATNREFTEDFLLSHPCDYVVMVNTTSPALRVETIRAFCEFMSRGEYDTVLSTLSEQAETFFQYKPLNFNLEEKVNSQLLLPVEKVVWALTAWRRECFLKLQNEGRNPIFGGKLTTFPIPKDEACDLDTEEDWRIAEGILQSRHLHLAPQYYEKCRANPADRGPTPHSFSGYAEYLKNGFENIQVFDGQGQTLSPDEGIRLLAEKTLEVQRMNSTIFFAGNGASASMSEHMSADLFKNGNVNTVCCSETAYITAIGNDISFEEIFAFKIRKSSHAGDMLVTISSSGNSKNIINAINAAHENGCYVVTFSGFAKDNKSMQCGDLNFFVPSLTYGTVEVLHTALLHCWIDQYFLLLKAQNC